MIMRKRLELCLESSSDGKRKLMSSRNSLTCTEAAPLPPTVDCSFSAAAGGLFSGGGGFGGGNKGNGFGCDDEEFRKKNVIFAQGPVKMMADDLDAEEATHVPGSDNVGGEVMVSRWRLLTLASLLL
ncbi:hypothetical protein F2Q70_00020710 [Brassica cretica]|uniref:Uncharacterized protein n=1 Tax=Brassica cretica TaxID=69181 RepID=A0A8S9GVH6_BRACR|nr:hypothetical protein F2Q70_00020710 [Brassica cretica]